MYDGSIQKWCVMKTNFTLLTQTFFSDSTDVVAQKLLGMFVIRVIDGNTIVGRIVETESYTYNDPASHCYQKRTERNKVLFGSVGHAYVYKIYGIHYGFNVVAHSPADVAGGVLIRALEPVFGISAEMLTNGPGKLTKALRIDTRFYGHNLHKESELFIARPEEYILPEVQATPRIGISKAQEEMRRFIIASNKYITPHRYNKR